MMPCARRAGQDGIDRRHLGPGSSVGHRCALGTKDFDRCDRNRAGLSLDWWPFALEWGAVS
jgi:hypothetical protein